MILRFFAAHPTAANLMMILAFLLGAISLPEINRATFPTLPLDQVQVEITYPGASTEEAEEALCQRIEDALDGITGLERMACEARENLARATLDMDLDDGNFDRFFTDIKAEIDAIDDFPADAEEPVVRQLGRTDLVTAIAISGDMARPDLKAYTEAVKRRLQRLPEVSQVDVQGFSDRQIRIEVPADALRQYGLSVSDIASTISRQSLDLPGGSLKTRDQDILIRFQDERRSTQDFQDLIVVAGDSGAEIRLGDVATITDQFELDEERYTFNGKPAALLQVNRTRSQDTLDVIAEVEVFLEGERARAPAGIELSLTRNVSSIVEDRLVLLTQNGIMGLVLVFLVMWLFFSLRYSFWVAMGLPVSFAASFFVMAATGLTFNMISMVGLLVAVGLLMDDAIVIAENIAAARARGLPPQEAAVEGARQVMPGVLSSFATTVMIFLPLAFLAGDLGQTLRDMPIILLTVLTISLIEAFLILPNHLYHSLLHEKEPGSLRRAFDQGFTTFRDNTVVPFVDVVIRARYFSTSIALALLVLAIGMVMTGVVKFRAFPELDGETVVARVLLPQGTPLARTEEVVDRLVEGLDKTTEILQPQERDGVALVRNVLVQYNTNTTSFETGAHVATIFVDLRTAEDRYTRGNTFLEVWRRETGAISDVLALTFQQSQGGPAGLAIDLELVGEDLDVLKTASLELQGWLSQYEGVNDLSDDLRPGKPELRIRMREGAASLGFDAETIARQLRAAFFGTTADEIQVGRESYEIDIRLKETDRDALGDLASFTVTGAQGVQVPLASIVHIEQGRGIARINRVNRQRTVTIQGDVDFSKNNAGEILADTQARFVPEFLERHPGVRMNVEGQEAEANETLASLQRAAALGLFGVFLLLSLQFRSYIEPLIVMMIIPLAYVGVVFGHMIMGLDLSMPSMMGFVSLAGIVVNNSILLVSFVKHHGAMGASIHDAVVNAARDRFRPILITSLTTFAGLIPILSETSMQAQVLIPLVTSLAFGIVATAVLVLLIVPSTYAILEDFGATTFVRKQPGDDTIS